MSRISKIRTKISKFNPFHKKIGFKVVISCFNYLAEAGGGQNYNNWKAWVRTNFFKKKLDLALISKICGKGLKRWIFLNPFVWHLKRRGLTSWVFFINMFLYLSSGRVEKMTKNHNDENQNFDLWFLAFFCRYELDRYRHILTKINQLAKTHRIT